MDNHISYMRASVQVIIQNLRWYAVHPSEENSSMMKSLANVLRAPPRPRESYNALKRRQKPAYYALQGIRNSRCTI
jgi:hypothetical protein